MKLKKAVWFGVFGLVIFLIFGVSLVFSEDLGVTATSYHKKQTKPSLDTNIFKYIDKLPRCKKYGFIDGISRVSCTTCHHRQEPKPVAYGLNDLDLSFAQLKKNTLYLNFDCDVNTYLVDKLRRTLGILDGRFKKIVITIKSYGGGLYDALAVISMLEEVKMKGVDLVTKCEGNAMSAGMMIFLAGDERIISETSILMWHEILSVKFLALEQVTDKENEAKVYRYLQNTVNNYIAKRTKMTKQELDERVKSKELWLNGKDALTHGFATRLIK